MHAIWEYVRAMVSPRHYGPLVASNRVGNIALQKAESYRGEPNRPTTPCNLIYNRMPRIYVMTTPEEGISALAASDSIRVEL